MMAALRPSLVACFNRQSTAGQFAYMPLRCLVCGGVAFDCPCVRAALSDAERRQVRESAPPTS